jgi:hypothetical protein
MTLSPVPDHETATNKFNSGLQQTDVQPLADAAVLLTQFMPSGEVITLLVVPPLSTAQNMPSSGLQQTERQALSTADICESHASLNAMTYSFYIG